jgi:hypothetical protein
MYRTIVFAIIIISLISCISETDTDTNDESCTYDLGTQMLSDYSKAQWPYNGKSSVIFIDSFGIKKIFDLKFEETYAKTQHSITLKDTTINGVKYQNKTITNCMLSQSNVYYLQENGGSLLLQATVFNDFDQSYLQKSVIDEAEISIVDNGKIEELFPYFNMRVDSKSSADKYKDSLIVQTSLTIFGKSFSNVLKNKFDSPQLHIVQYNKTEGIVSFTEANGRKWRFESMN